MGQDGTRATTIVDTPKREITGTRSKAPTCARYHFATEAGSHGNTSNTGITDAVLTTSNPLSAMSRANSPGQ